MDGIADPNPDWAERTADAKARRAAEYREKLGPQLEWLGAIRDALPRDGIFVDELTQTGYVSRFAFPSYHPRSFISTGYQGTLGYGFATAFEVAHARRDVPVLAISGDGGALFTISSRHGGSPQHPADDGDLQRQCLRQCPRLQMDNYDSD